VIPTKAQETLLTDAATIEIQAGINFDTYSYYETVMQPCVQDLKRVLHQRSLDLVEMVLKEANMTRGQVDGIWNRCELGIDGGGS
jgi:hypothetical protein